MAHWDDSGTAVGYEGKKGDKLILKSLGMKTARKKKTKKVKIVKPVVAEHVAILDEGEDLDHLCSVFGVNDEGDIDGILNGTVGEEEW